MPDWFYRTVSRPLLFRLPAPTARDLSLGLMGGLAGTPVGPMVIDFLGHMAPDERLTRNVLGIEMATPLGLGPGIDARAQALTALTRFGFGFMEIGPIALSSDGRADVSRDDQTESIHTPVSSSLACDERLLRRLHALRRSNRTARVIARLDGGQMSLPDPANEWSMIAKLSPWVDAFATMALERAVSSGWSLQQFREYAQALIRGGGGSEHSRRPLLLTCPASMVPAEASSFIAVALEVGMDGIIVDGASPDSDGGRTRGLSSREPARALVEELRARFGGTVVIIAGGGVHEPADALALIRAGADLIEVDTGLVFSGPGLPKRINDALLHDALVRNPATPRQHRTFELTWFWSALLGAGMLGGAILALVIAFTRVVLPYDEAYLGMSVSQIAAINPRLLAFMTHDRVSLAGTMLSVGGMYLGLSLFGIRSGQTWAWHVVLLSALTGFASFFLFLGFGYLDIFHAFVSSILFQILLMAIHSRMSPYESHQPPPLFSDSAWRMGLWGKLLLILHGASLLAAGVTISAIGVTSVFVPEDLHFMATSAEALSAANPNLVPLVAHDRATFGGMLLASGWVFLCSALWGFRAGQGWLWWLTLICGLSAYAPAVAVHLIVGYTDAMHLVPVLAGPALLLVGLLYSYSYLCQPDRVSGSAR